MTKRIDINRLSLPCFVIEDLQRGKLQTLSDYLTRNQGIPDPEVAAALCRLINGSVTEASFRLVAGRHPDLPPKKRGPKAKTTLPTERDLVVSEAICCLLAEGVPEAAAAAEVAEKQSIASSTVRRIRKKVADYFKQSKAEQVEHQERERVLTEAAVLRDEVRKLILARRQSALAKLKSKGNLYDSR